jgi:CSLREA domain-containing protein
MRPKLLLPFIALLFVLTAASESTTSAQSKGVVITVNSVSDSFDAAPGNGRCADLAGKCSLRAAIAESNASPAKDAIIFDVPVPAVITLDLGELTITNSVGIFGRGARNLTIQRNTAPNFNAFRIFNITASVHLRGMTISNGRSFSVGGGILTNSPIRVYDVAIKGNRAGFGGGFAIQGQGLPISASYIERCLIAENIADSQGGGMYIAPGMGITVMSTTIGYNSAPVGGGLAVFGGLALANNTITANSATQSASSIENSTGGSIYVVNTIIGPDTHQSVSSLSGNFSSMGRNFVTNTTNSTGWGSSDITGTNNSIDPLLGPFTNNGGQTDSFALLQGSPAIDAGDLCVQIGLGCGSSGIFFDLYYDQQKSRRFFGNRPDIGALESGAQASTVVTTHNLYSGMPTLANSRVTVTDTETMERRYYIVNTGLGTSAVSLDWNRVYLIEIATKRMGGFAPGLQTLGGAEFF